MPLDHAIWRIAQHPEPLMIDRLASEQLLEDMIVRDMRILSPDWMLIGQQILTGLGGKLDLLAIARDGSLVLIELKRDRTPRDVVAQTLDYAYWVQRLSVEEILMHYSKFSKGGNLSDAFKARFGSELDEEELNSTHQMIVVASELDAHTERIVQYLSERDIPINVLFFRVFKNGDEQLLSRSWMIDPAETQINTANTAMKGGKEREPWNGEYYVSFGGSNARSWADAMKYGFISAGGGSWYSQTLKQLEVGARIWVKIPQTGYVGVGRVTGPVSLVGEFAVQTPGGLRPVLEVLQHAETFKADAQDPEKAERFVPVEWFHTVPEDQAVNDLGLFGNQNTVAKPTVPKWRHTIEVLKGRFPNHGG